MAGKGGGARGPLPGGARGARGGAGGALGGPLPVGAATGWLLGKDGAVGGGLAAEPLGLHGSRVGLGLPVLVPIGGGGGGRPFFQPGGFGTTGLGFLEISLFPLESEGLA